MLLETPAEAWIQNPRVGSEHLTKSNVLLPGKSILDPPKKVYNEKPEVPWL